MTTMAATVTLKTAIGPHGHFAALKNGGVKPDRIKFDHVEVEPIRNAFRRMCRNQEFDVSEMAIVTFLLAKEYGRPFTGLPVFPARNFWHGAFNYNVKSGIKGPKDLEGKRGGVRAYTQTSGVWARGILSDEYGVDLTKLNWIHADEEHVEEFYKVQPPNIKYQIGCDLAKMLAEGELDFAMGVGGRDAPPEFKPLFPEPRVAAADWYRRTALYPIDHMVVVKTEILNQHPWLAEALFQAFKEAKAQWQAQAPETDWNTLAGSTIPGDRYPYGVEKNRKTIETMIRMAREQKVLNRPFTVEELFAPSTLKLE